MLPIQIECLGEIAPPVLRGLQLATGHTDSARGLRLGGAGAGRNSRFYKEEKTNEIYPL